MFEVLEGDEGHVALPFQALRTPILLAKSGTAGEKSLRPSLRTLKSGKLDKAQSLPCGSQPTPQNEMSLAMCSAMPGGLGTLSCKQLQSNTITDDRELILPGRTTQGLLVQEAPSNVLVMEACMKECDQLMRRSRAI